MDISSISLSIQIGGWLRIYYVTPQESTSVSSIQIFVIVSKGVVTIPRLRLPASLEKLMTGLLNSFGTCGVLGKQHWKASAICGLQPGA